MSWRHVLACVAIAFWSTATSAQTVEFSAQVREGETFARPLPGDLLLCLVPEAEYGWVISIATSCARAAHNFAMAATPPYRGVNPIQIYSWHFLPDAQIFSETRTFHFVLNDRDYQTIMEMLRSRHDAGELLKLVSKLGNGKGELRVLETETAPGAAEERPRLVRVSFSAKLTFP